MLQNFFFFFTDTNGNPTRPKFSSKAKSQPTFSKIQAAHLTTSTNLQRQGMDYGRKKSMIKLLQQSFSRGISRESWSAEK